MENAHTPRPRACALPHTAPLAWLRQAAEAQTPDTRDPVDIVMADERSPEEQRRDEIMFHMHALEDLAAAATDARPARRDGWTPFVRKLFLSTLADTGRVNLACDYCNLSKQSAYALRARDPVFAAGWDAAAELARDSLADTLLERALDGSVETIRRGEQVIERHRFDNRFAMALLSRLDRRCDRSAQRPFGTASVKAQWDRFLDAVGADDDATAQDILVPPPPPRRDALPDENAILGQASQLRSMIDDEGEPKVWWNADRAQWRTSFPHPDGDDAPDMDPPDVWVEGRPCTPEEADLLDRAADCAGGDDEEERAAQEARTAYFDELRVWLAQPDEDADSEEAEEGDTERGDAADQADVIPPDAAGG